MSNPGPHSEHTSLALRVAAGDKAATEELYGRYGEALYPFVLKKLGPGNPRSHDLVDDILQDGFVAAIDELRAGKFDPVRGSFFPWIRTLVLRDLIDRARREKRAPVAVEHIPDSPVRSPGPLTRVALDEEQQERLASVREQLSSLHEPYLLALVSRDLLKLGPDDAAAETGMTRRQNIDAYHRGKHAIEKLLSNGIKDWVFFVDYVDWNCSVRTMSEAERQARGDAKDPGADG
ncbi:MAG: sigma-70 family RNA polymerase sigma factor [Planctomycetota bacterium]